MSRTLKRPMFRKGGEVMEGIMTGIKPRKMYALGTGDQGIVDNVRRKMNLIDVVAGTGSSPLGDPLTQFLLSTGQNLIGGESAGGTKLQELVGATKKPLDRAMKMQQLKDMSNRKLATSLIAKSKLGGAEQAWRDYGKDSGLTKEQFVKEFAQKELFKKKTNPEDRAFQRKRDISEDLGKYKDFLRNPKYNPLQKGRIEDAIAKLEADPALEAQVDSSNPFISKGDYSVGTSTEINNKKVKVLIPDDKDDFEPGLRYFVVDYNAFFIYDADNNQLIELPGI
jgi:hypothetical protein